jgi:hypothetical protein
MIWACRQASFVNFVSQPADEDMKNLFYMMIFCTISFLLYSCSSGNKITEQPLKESIQPPQLVTNTVEWTPTLIITTTPSPNITPQVEQNRGIGDDELLVYDNGSVNLGSIEHLWWGANSQTLFFRTDNDVREYSISTEEVNQVNISPVPDTTSVPEILSSIPFAATRISISPNGDKALFLLAIEYREDPEITPTPTPTTLKAPVIGENEGGEDSDVRMIDLWLLSRGNLIRLAEIDNCVENYFWSFDQSKVLIAGSAPPAACTTSAWSVEIENLSVISLLPKDKYPTNIHIFSASPDVSKLLFSRGRKIYLLNVNTLKSAEVPIGPFNITSWLDQNNLLVAYNSEQLHSWVISKIEINSMIEDPILKLAERTKFKGYQVNELRISPDGSKIAIAIGKHSWVIDSVWVFNRPK